MVDPPGDLRGDVHAAAGHHDRERRTARDPARPGASFSDLQWVVDAYSLTLAAFLLTAGVLGDRLGRRSVFASGSRSSSWLRCCAASRRTPPSSTSPRGAGGRRRGDVRHALALIAQEFQGPERATAFGIWGATVGGAVAIGPLVGGALTDALGWEWIFFVNVPIGIAAIALTLTRVAESRDRDAAAGRLGGCRRLLAPPSSRPSSASCGVTPRAGASTVIVASLGGAVAAAGCVRRRSSCAPRTRCSTSASSGSPPSSASPSVAFALSAGMFSMFLYLTIYMQDILGYDAARGRGALPADHPALVLRRADRRAQL